MTTSEDGEVVTDVGIEVASGGDYVRVHIKLRGSSMAAPRKSPSRPNNEDTVAVSSSAPSAKKQRTVAPESPQSVATVLENPSPLFQTTIPPETPPSEFCLHDVDEDDHASLAPPPRRFEKGEWPPVFMQGFIPLHKNPFALCATLIILIVAAGVGVPLLSRLAGVSPAHTDEVLMSDATSYSVNPASLRPPRAWTWPMVPPYPTLNVDPVLTLSLVLPSVQDECDLSPVSRVWSWPAAPMFSSHSAHSALGAVSDGMPEGDRKGPRAAASKLARSAWHRMSAFFFRPFREPVHWILLELSF